jgi:S1-C subfamily serine protease
MAFLNLLKRREQDVHNHFAVNLAVTALLGFAAGAVGMLVSSVYFASPATVTMTSIPKAGLTVNRVDSKRLATSESAVRAAVAFFEAKSATDLPVGLPAGASTAEGAYLDVESVGSGMILTSDGWIVAHADSLRARAGSSLVARVMGRFYPVKETVGDPYSDAVFFRVDARDLPVVALAKGTVGILPGDSLFSFDTAGGVRRLEIVSVAVSAAEKPAELVRPAERLSRYFLATADSALHPGAMVLNDRAEAVGLVTEIREDGSYIMPVEAWGTVIDGVLKNQVPERPYLGVSYIDLAEVGGFGEDGQPAKGAQIEAVVKGGPAEQAGLRKGDVITAVSGEFVTARKPLSEILVAYEPGMSVTLTYRRDGSMRTAEAKLLGNVADFL